AVSFARVRRPVLPTRILTIRAEAANPMATMICRRTGRYSRIIAGSDVVLEPLRYFTTASLGPGIWPFGGAIALARAEGNPLYFLPVFFTAPRATRFCSFS